MRYFIFLVIHLFIAIQANAQDTTTSRPKIGLTLSGGGAKGLAHIGILKAIDSAGLKIDFITGTSMGAIIGSLYASGYSGYQIEKIARKIDWDILLSNQLSLRSLSMEEKDEYGKYTVELPYINHKLRLPGGFLEGQELSFKFNELFYPVYKIKDFNNLSIPFKCIATDISTGQAVVFDSGDITTAVRASMAIPSVFTAVEYKGYKLVDGGLVRNFPVRDVKEMGADLVIGSSVTAGLSPKEKLSSALDIILQLAFFKEAEDYKKEVPLCDIYVAHPVAEYSMGSFNNTEKLIDIGLEEGRKLYPALKRMADSLNEKYGVLPFQENRLPLSDSIYISSYEITGLNKTTKEFFLHTMGINLKRSYSEADLSKMVRRVYGTRYYSSINYTLQSQPDSSSKIIFTVKENPSTYAKLGLHYNEFSGISVITNLTTRDLFFRYSRSSATVSIGENTRLKGEHLQYFGLRKNIAVIPKFQLENFKTNTYNEFVKSGQYRQLYYTGEIKAQYSGNRNFTSGIGTRYEFVNFKPLILSDLKAKGRNDFFTSFIYFDANTLDKRIYPKRGFRINAEFGFVYNQNPRATFYSNGIPVTNLDSIGINYDDYQRSVVNVEAFIPLSKRLTFQLLLQTGINFNYKQNLVNNFQVGGLTKTIRNQVIFAGLDETTISTPSVAALMLGLNFQLSKNIFLMAKSNALVNNFMSKDRQLQLDNWITGHALVFAYTTPIGPLEFSVAYSEQSGKILTYANFGIPF
jgi:NTE family protein